MKNNKSFTLLEILVVTTIITLLGTTGFSSYTTTVKNARDTKRKADLEYVKTGIFAYYQVKKLYPNSINWGGNSLDLGEGKYVIENTPKDPMSGYSYQYLLTPTENSPFKLCAILENSQLPAISGTNCPIRECNYCTTLTGLTEN
jgi:type II secretory pathway pseudopilin PulG